MRKHKSVVAILLAVMMIFTFMPTMAFANVIDVKPAGQAKYFDWADDFSSVTYNGQEATVVRDTDSHGLTTATATATTGSYPEGSTAPTSTVFYYDFKDAQISFVNPALNSFYRLQNNQPATILLKDMSTNDPKQNGISTNTFTNWTVKYITDTSLDNTSDVSADVAVSFECDSLSEKYTGLNSAYPAFVNTSAMKKTITVKGKNSVMPQFYEMVNGVKVPVELLKNVNTRGEFVYDGKEHTIMIDPVDGYTLKVTVQDPTTGKFRDATEADMKYKNAGERVALKAVYVPNTEFTIALPEASRQQGDTIATTVVGSGVVPFFGWVAGNSTTKVNDGRQAYVYDLTTEQAADPTAFVQVTKALNDEDAKEIKDVFNEFYTIKVADNKADSNLKTWTIALKGTDAKAVEKAHAQLWKNYDMTAFDKVNDANVLRSFDKTLGAATPNISVKVAAAVVTNDKEDDISFEGQTKFTYNGKQTTKKGVLKTKKTITVNATADSGNAIKYVATKTAGGKIVVSDSGKITVKKGLKKGTYSVIVKAKTEAGNGYKAAKEKQTYKIVIKK